MRNPVKRPIAKQKTDAEEHLMKMSYRVGDLRVWATPAIWGAHGFILLEQFRFLDVFSQESQHARFLLPDYSLALRTRNLEFCPSETSSNNVLASLFC